MSCNFTTSLCCIGGVCIPQSAVVPVLLLLLRWLLAKAVALGLIPQAVLDKFLPQSTKYAPTETVCSDKPCCTGGDGAVKSIESEEEFREILKEPTVIVKFTATWYVLCAMCNACCKWIVQCSFAANSYAPLQWHAFFYYSKFSFSIPMFSMETTTGASHVRKSNQKSMPWHKNTKSRPRFVLLTWMSSTIFHKSTALLWCRRFLFSKEEKLPTPWQELIS